jgi:hypothetical protein
MKRLILAVAILALAVAMPVSAPAAPHKHKNPKPLPDLIVASVAVRVPSTGSTPYIQVYPDGHTTPFDVRVDVENIGKAAAPQTHLKVHFPGHALTAHTIVPPLAPGAQVTVVIVMHHVTLQGLAPLKPVAVANWNFHVPEKHYTNNQGTGEAVAVIAHRWRVAPSQWTYHFVDLWHGGTIDCTGHNVGQSEFWLRTYDSNNKIFWYWVAASTTEDCSFTLQDPNGNKCTGKGSGDADHAKWPTTSYFGISYAEDSYATIIDMSAEQPVTMNITCPEGTSTANYKLTRFTTSPVPIAAPVGAAHLSNTGKLAAGTATITYTWKFDAVIPGCIAC